MMRRMLAECSPLYMLKRVLLFQKMALAYRTILSPIEFLCSHVHNFNRAVSRRIELDPEIKEGYASLNRLLFGAGTTHDFAALCRE